MPEFSVISLAAQPTAQTTGLFLDVPTVLIAAAFSAVVSWAIVHTQRNFEHRQWRRNQKHIAYVKFWDARREVLNTDLREKDSVQRAALRDEHLKNLRPTSIRLLAPDHIKTKTMMVYKGTKSLLDDHKLDRLTDQQRADLQAKVAQESKELMALFEEDINRTPGSLLDALGQGLGRRLKRRNAR